MSVCSVMTAVSWQLEVLGCNQIKRQTYGTIQGKAYVLLCITSGNLKMSPFPIWRCKIKIMKRKLAPGPSTIFISQTRSNFVHPASMHQEVANMAFSVLSWLDFGHLKLKLKDQVKNLARIRLLSPNMYFCSSQLKFWAIGPRYTQWLKHIDFYSWLS